MALFKTIVGWSTNSAIWLYIVLVVAVIIFLKIILSYSNTHTIAMASKKPLKIVVFDLDETLGYFTELGMFWDALEKYYGHNLFSDKFFEVLDIFPEFFRPDIMNIVDIIKNKKTCHKIIMYTNNQGPKSWITMISDYFNKKLGFNVFDRIIAAYKINGRQIEPKRTSHDKSTLDLFNILEMHKNTEVCFIDDLYHPLMDKENVFYINIKPYRMTIPYNEMAERYYYAVLYKNNIDKLEFIKSIVSFMQQYNYMIVEKTKEEKKMDVIVSKKLLMHLEEFLKDKKITKTRRKQFKRFKTMRQMMF
jgi:hypothetical protein